jgi:ribosomal protein L11 methylase PrmA
VVDLGCGDGRIVIAAAKRFGARGLGVDLDPDRVRESRTNAVAAGVSERVEFRTGDLMQADLRAATVVAIFLSADMNLRLRPKLLAELRPGTRVVSNGFDMGDWKPDAVLQHADAYDGVLCLWTIPPRAAAPRAGATPAKKE